MMWRPVLAIVALIVCGGGFSESRAQAGRRVRVLSYNIHHGEGMDGRIDLARLARVIQEAEPDVVALQEVDRNVERSGGVDQAAELARLTSLELRFGRTIPLQGGEYGNAILSRWPITGSTNHPLPSPAGGEARAVLEVEVAMPTDVGGDVRITVLGTHFHHTQDATNRIASAEAIATLFPPGFRVGPMLLVGDLNAVPESRPIELLRALWSVAGGTALTPTSPAPDPRRKIDYVMFRPRDRWRVVESRVLPEAVASDHRPVLAVLELLPG